MTAAYGTAHDEAQIRARLDEWVKATRAMDIDEIMAFLTPDVRSFDCHSRFQLNDAAAYREHMEACFPCMQGPMIFEIHDLDVTAQDQVAFCHASVRCGGTSTDGQEHVGWLRVTLCLRKMEGQWMIAHDHFSAPFDPETGKAMLDLTPEPVEQESVA